jgi:short-subunit dehydrogenase
MFEHKKYQENKKRVLITGASKGIGLAAAERLAKEGYIVYATVRDPSNARDLQTLATKYPNLYITQLDVTDSEENIKSIVNKMGVIDILINNAGIGLYGPVETATDKENRRVFDTNVFGLLKVTNAVLPGMRKRNSGRIVTLSSVVGPLPDPYQPAYSASKAAVESYMAVLRRDLAIAGKNIIVCNVNPGPVFTPFESSTLNASRFTKETNPYPQMDSGRATWTAIMQNNGRPVQETVDTILKVIKLKNPDYWNPTEEEVRTQFERVYKDISGNNYMAGLQPQQAQEIHSPILSKL